MAGLSGVRRRVDIGDASRVVGRPSRRRIASTSVGFRTGTLPMHQPTDTCRVPTNSASRRGSPSSNSMVITSWRFAVSSLSVSALRVRSRKTGHVTDEKSGFGVALDHRREALPPGGARRSQETPHRFPRRWLTAFATGFPLFRHSCFLDYSAILPLAPHAILPPSCAGRSATKTLRPLFIQGRRCWQRGLAATRPRAPLSGSGPGQNFVEFVRRCRREQSRHRGRLLDVRRWRQDPGREEGVYRPRLASPRRRPRFVSVRASKSGWVHRGRFCAHPDSVRHVHAWISVGVRRVLKPSLQCF